MKAPNQVTAQVQPIVSNRCLHRVYIDLMDFRSHRDGDFCWILQIKDHFSLFAGYFLYKTKKANQLQQL